MDDVHRPGAVPKDCRARARRDLLHPSDEDFGVGAVRIHPRPVDIEVPQRDVIEPTHVVEAVLHNALGPMQRPIVVGDAARRSGICRRGRTEADDAATTLRTRALTAASSTANDAIDEHILASAAPEHCVVWSAA